MIRFVLVLSIAIFIASCASTKNLKPFDSADLVGVWELKFDGVYPYWFSQIGFTEDGRKCVLSYEFDAKGIVGVDYYLNRYEIKDGYLYSEVGFSSTSYARSGEVIKDRIDVLEENYFEVFMVNPLPGSTAEKHQRLLGVSPEDLCQIVDNFRITSQARRTR